MYNRYIPQPDGTHRRNFVADPPPPPKPARPEPCPPPQPACPPKEPASPPPKPKPKPCRAENPGYGFLRQLLPKDFDTGDLIVVLLLLLMAGDCEEDRNHALLTIALYFIM